VRELDLAESIAREASLAGELVYLYSERCRKVTLLYGYQGGRKVTFSICDTLGKDERGVSKADIMRYHAEARAVIGKRPFWPFIGETPDI
jgi:hypothetical protein